VLGEAAFEEAWVAGQAMSLDEAVAVALATAPWGVPEPPEPPEHAPGAGALSLSRQQAGETAEIVESSAAERSGRPGGETSQRPLSPWAPLTGREGEVAVLVAQGLSNRQIAERLTITRNTAGVHVVHILNKLGLHSRAQIAAWAAAKGLADLAPKDKAVHNASG